MSCCPRHVPCSSSLMPADDFTSAHTVITSRLPLCRVPARDTGQHNMRFATQASFCRLASGGHHLMNVSSSAAGRGHGSKSRSDERKIVVRQHGSRASTSHQDKHGFHAGSTESLSRDKRPGPSSRTCLRTPVNFSRLLQLFYTVPWTFTPIHCVVLTLDTR